MIAKDNKVLLNNGYGLANVEKGILNSRDTYFDIGSITKQFTAAAILKLEMQGYLNTTDKISAYLTSLPEDKSDITIHHLLTHTSGIKDSTGDDYEIIDKEQALERILHLPLTTRPGENYLYCNDGYSILAAIIEEQTNEPYESYVKTNLFQPSRMNFTGYRIPEWIEENVSHGYVSGIDQGKPTHKNYPYWNLMGNGGMLSTTCDFYKWHQTLQGNKVLSEEAKRKLFTPYLNNYAYGWEVYSSPKGAIIEHDGASLYGTSAKISRYMDHNLVYILFCNTSFEQHTIAKIVSEKIEKILFQESTHLPTYTNEDKIISTDLSVYEGEYKIPSGGVFKAIVKGNSLQLSSFDQDCLSLLVWDTYDEVNLSEITETSLEVTEEIIRGRFDLLEALSEQSHEEFMRRKRVIRSVIENGQSTGGISQIKHFGTVPSIIIKGTIEVRIEIEAEKGSQYLLFFWKKDKISFAGFTGVKLQEDVVCLLSNGKFSGYHIAYEKNISFSFSQDTETGKPILTFDHHTGTQI